MGDDTDPGASSLEETSTRGLPLHTEDSSTSLPTGVIRPSSPSLNSSRGRGKRKKVGQKDQVGGRVEVEVSIDH